MTPDRSTTLLCVFLTLLFRGGLATYGKRYHYSSPNCDGQDGKPCKPYSYYDGNVCGERQLINYTTTAVSDGWNFGPNVCKTEYLYGRNAYRYEKNCKYRYSWYYGYKCKCSCEKGSVCDVPITMTKTKYHCCDGYTTRPVASDGGKTYYYEPNTYNILCTEGCPVEIKDTVLDCLEELGLTEMKDLLCGTSLESLLNSTTSGRALTVLGVPNGPLVDTGIRDLMEEDIEEVLSRHIIPGEKPLRSVAFIDGQSHETLIESCLVHVREIDEYKNTWYYGSYYKKHVGDQIFISGSEIDARDACIARNGVVHIVNKPVECSNTTIAKIVEEDSDYSILESLLVEADKLSFLDMDKPLLTLLAPTNDAFRNARTTFGYDIVACLRNNSDILRAFLHYHILCNAEFSSTLILDGNTLKTKACQSVQKEKCYYYYSKWYHSYYYGNKKKRCKTYTERKCQNLKVEVQDEGIQVIDGSSDTMRVFLSGLDIPASNGVIHELSLPLRVPTVDFDALCSGFVGSVGPPPPMPPPPPGP